jgi:RNA polymerase sigma-70 factor (ECF subfamily)
MLGDAADADDLVQDVFRRALEAPPHDLERDLRPWLVRVAMNASRDALRARKARGYRGTWLPSPIETAEPGPAEREREPDMETRYSELESVGFAFLIALEELSALQRAVLLLRDVFDYSVAETAHALSIGESNVKTTLHRARQAMSSYDAHPQRPSLARNAELLETLHAFCIHLFAHNVPALEKLLAEGVRARNDGNGEYFAARRPVLGLHKVILFSLKTSTYGPARFAIRTLNGVPAVVCERFGEPAGVPPRVAMLFQLDESGRICEMDAVVATRKLHAIRFDTLPRFTWLLLPALRAALRRPAPSGWLPEAARRIGRALARELSDQLERRLLRRRGRGRRR